MKLTTKEWLSAAEDDLITAKKLDDEMILLATINEVYIDARYPGDMGLMPQGKPTIAEAKRFIIFSQAILEKVQNLIQ